MLTGDSVQEYVTNTYQDVTSHVVSRLVLVGTWFVMWMALAEALSRATSIPIPLTASGPALYNAVSILLWMAAAHVVYLSFNLSLALVVEKEKGQLEEPRHIAYAWSCGLIGMAMLSAEVFFGLDLRFEDPLLGMAGLNTLVEEVRLRIAQAGKNTSTWV